MSTTPTESQMKRMAVEEQLFQTTDFYLKTTPGPLRFALALAYQGDRNRAYGEAANQVNLLMKTGHYKTQFDAWEVVLDQIAAPWWP